MNITLEGKILEVGKTEHISDKFTKRELIIECADAGATQTYTNTYKVEATQKNVDKLDAVKPGDMVKLSCNLKGKAYTKGDKTSYFTSIQVWKVERVQQSDLIGDRPHVSYSPNWNQPTSKATPSFDAAPSFDNDLPF